MKSPIVAGNWKMHMTHLEGREFIKQVDNLTLDIATVKVIFCPPFSTLFHSIEILKNSDASVGSQNCHWEKEGAFTGEISVRMLDELGVQYVIIGHSERRHIFKESDEWINKKILAVVESGLKPIFCIGETLQNRENGLTEIVLSKQLERGLAGVIDLSGLVIAYEPVWAIGTGKVATGSQIEDAHTSIKNWLKINYSGDISDQMTILYGGSVNSKNTKELIELKGVDGFLIGGASLQIENFNEIIHLVEQFYRG
jgi:triosephosphate isomerase